MKFGLDSVEKIVNHIMLQQKTEIIQKIAKTIDRDRGMIFEAKVTINGVEIEFEKFEEWLMETYKQVHAAAKIEFADIERAVDNRVEKRLKDGAQKLIDKMDDLRYKLDDIESYLTPDWEKK